MSGIDDTPVGHPSSFMVFPAQAKENGFGVYPKGRIRFVEIRTATGNTERNRRKRERRARMGKRR